MPEGPHDGTVSPPKLVVTCNRPLPSIFMEKISQFPHRSDANITASLPSCITRSGQRSLEPSDTSSNPRVRFKGAEPSAFARNMSQSPSRSLANAMRQPSCDHAGSRSSPGSLVKLTGEFEGPRVALIPCAKISKFPVRLDTKATLSPEAVIAGASSLPDSVVNLDTSLFSSLKRYISEPTLSVPSRVLRSELNASTRLPEREGCRSLEAFRVRFVRLEPFACME